MDTKRLCPSCQKPLAPDVPMGLCPECLIKSGFPTGADTETESGVRQKFVPPTVEEVSKIFPQLEILEFLGNGGMGAVYKARQKQLNRLVALKILPSGIGQDAAFADRFTREARALAQLNHPGIVTLFEFGETNGQFYFLMEFVDGVNLRQLLANGRVSPREALAIVPQICDALQFAHDHGIVHRDIKPENILVDRRGRVKLADFGLAKLMGGGVEVMSGQNAPTGSVLTESGKVMGTPNYMSPEQKINAAEVDHRADIYALGVVFYQMLTGELPGKPLQPPSAKVEVDVRLDEIVLRALEKKPERRYQQASVMKTEIETVSAGERAGISAARTRDESRIPRWARAIAGGVIGALVVLAVLNAPKLLETRKAVKVTPQEEANEPKKPSVMIETWSPTVAAGEKVDLQKVLDEAKELMTKGQYEEALQRRIWYYNHALESNDSYQRLVRLSSSFIEWVELGRRYPKAKQALLEIRDRDVREFKEGRGYFDLFMELSNINRFLQDDGSTVAAFKNIQGDKQLASQCFPMVEDLLIERGDYELAMNFVGDPQRWFEGRREMWERTRQMENQRSALQQEAPRRFDAMTRTNAAYAKARTPTIPGPPLTADKTFIKQTRQLIEVLVGVGRKADAQKIQDQALGLLDDENLKSAVSDAVARVQKRASATKQ